MDENRVAFFAETDYRNRRDRFGIKAKDRTKHVYVIGKTGMGKSTMLENMAIQDIQNGEGLAFVDPHGASAERLLDYVPRERIRDVLYFAPFDLDHPVSFNVMEDVGIDQRHLVVNGLMASFKKIWPDVWSARMEYILSNILLALIEYPNSTLLGVNRMLGDKEYRKLVVDNTTDPTVKSFWLDEFARYTDRYMQEAGAAIQNKIGQFTSSPLIRNIVGQPKSSFDVRQMMDKRKIIIANLSKGRMGEINSHLIGGMLITKIYLAAMSRADLNDSQMRTMPNFYLFVDEFQSFANETFANILSEARKYKLNLTLAHQYIEQMVEEVRYAVFGNVGTLISFRVGATDAEYLEKEFSPEFMAEDLVNLGFAQVYLRLMIDGIGSRPFSARTIPLIPPPPHSFREDIIRASRETFGQTREKVETDILHWYQPVKQPPALPREGSRTPEYLERPQRPPSPSPRRTLPREIREKAEVRSAYPPTRPSDRQVGQAGRTGRPVPLASLLKEKKSIETGNLHELRKDLREVLEDSNVDRDRKEKERGTTVPMTKANTPPLPQKEIPEDVLRKMLEVE